MNAESSIAAEAEIEGPTPARSRRVRTVLMLAGPILVILGALYFYLSGGRYESTDNASLQTGMVAISPSVSGKVIAIAVRENQRVRQGEVLFRIKPDTFQAALAEAEAELANARTDVGSLQADYREALSDVSAARARYDYATSEAARQRSLVGEGISSRAQYDEAATAVRTARDAIAAAQAKAESLRARLAGNVSGGSDAQPGVRSAASKVEQARIDLSDTVVRAPQDGIVTRVNQLQVGNYVTPGRPVFMLTGLRYWVQANFKEDQLRYMRVGQPAEIEIDAFPDRHLKGHVESFSPGTGSSFSVLPAENATGNWVKVVQRLPVQVAIDQVPADLPLSAGLSVDVKVDTGHQRHLFGADTPARTPAKP
ncbi:HlyD family secretion protein [Novosphingobium album (ex Liu et al. 2023)]|uniref:HlyD family secretion protein n=1 Tax=Novosphingobium album (ex Liu et al. 2023) TaxID=3031130 RepID=A0ABT5WUH0_9SPHN|nr:HlyD family secretion protein [Novosphingobium album (ex Liu et al. 2023)]MDE8653550.1 HlyD family secretion protein [Novosphingobium album (ex Liu et al. 2023)]